MIKVWTSVLKMRTLNRQTGKWERGYHVFKGVTNV